MLTQYMAILLPNVQQVMRSRPDSNASLYSFVRGCTGTVMSFFLVMVASPAEVLAVSGLALEKKASQFLLANIALTMSRLSLDTQVS